MDRLEDARRRDWAEFFLEHHRALTAYGLSLVGNLHDAQDLIQDVLCRLVAGRRPIKAAKPYVMRCMRNLAIDRRRKARRSDGAPASRPCSTAFLDTDAGGPDRRALTERICSMLETLPDARREVIVLRVYGGLAFREVAEVLGRPLGSVSSDYARGVEELRGLLVEEVNHVRS